MISVVPVALLLLGGVGAAACSSSSTSPTVSTASAVPGTASTPATNREPVSTGTTAATTTRPPGPQASFRSAGRTLNVKPSAFRRDYGALGDTLTIPEGTEVEFGAPGASAAVTYIITKDVWGTGVPGDFVEVFADVEGRFIWPANAQPGEYGLEVTFTLPPGVPVTYRAPIRVTPRES